MVFEEKRCKLKDGREALFRSPCEEDAEEMLQFIIRSRRSMPTLRWNRKRLLFATPATIRTE